MTVRVFLATKAKSGHAEKMYSQLEKQDGVEEIHLVDEGIYDVIALVEVDSLDSYRELVDKVAHMKGLLDFESFIRTDSD